MRRWRKYSQEEVEFDTGQVNNLFGRGSLTAGENWARAVIGWMKG